MKHYPHASAGALVAALLCLSGSPLAAQVPGGVAEAAGSVGQALGPQALATLVSVEGGNGLPLPKFWDFTVADPATRNGVRVLRATHQRAVPLGERAGVPVGYPLNIPGGFFRWADVKIDSSVAFAAADREARGAMVGFDAVHYLLRARDGTSTPAWTLTLIDAEGRAVGRVEIDASSGMVQRKVWLRYAGPGSPALIRIEDSASPFTALRPPPPQPVALPPGGGTVPAPATLPVTPEGNVPPPAPSPDSPAALRPLPPPAAPAPGYTPLPP